MSLDKRQEFWLDLVRKFPSFYLLSFSLFFFPINYFLIYCERELTLKLLNWWLLARNFSWWMGSSFFSFFHLVGEKLWFECMNIFFLKIIIIIFKLWVSNFNGWWAFFFFFLILVKTCYNIFILHNFLLTKFTKFSK